MGLLLYKSNEMFSATELIRKSKMIFDKIIDDEIDKAIILRDGKPSFLLMDFEKYEKIMAEFEGLKQQSQTEIKLEKIKNKEKKKKPKDVLEDVSKVVPNIVDKVVVIAKEEPTEKQPIEDISQNEQISETKEKETIVELSEEEELNNAFLTIENMNFNDDMKKEAQDKIKIKILQARKERAEILAAQEQELQKEDEEELELKQHIEEEKIKKQRELKEFWD